MTQCCIHALYLSGREAQQAVDLAKNFERRRCNHRVEADGKMKDPAECLADVVGELFLLSFRFPGNLGCPPFPPNILCRFIFLLRC